MPEEQWKNKNIYEKNGKKIHTWFHLQKIGKFRVELKNIIIDSIRKQGIALFFSEGFRGKVSFNGESLKIPKTKFGHYKFRQEEILTVGFVIDATVENGCLVFANASTEPNCLDSYENSALGREFWIEILSENVYRFHCNDNFEERTYTHFIFDMVITDLE